MQRRKNKNNTITDWRSYKIGIVVSEFNSDITENLLQGALDFLEARGFEYKNIEIVKVSGSFEIPFICQHLARMKKFDGLIAIGAVIKGDTDHYYYIAGEASRGIMNVMLAESLPIGFGVITTSNLKQAKIRSGSINNKGAEAAEALLKTFQIITKK